ncbi:hypothetical protein NA57DRAFT_71038 [Rhizodiscina lignyota]|uniref:Uncharacterized protein n=1 Tax=Rhizodiscina lignyota TaxID=1504668 RepID=A0A9P4MB78_9PEZI|nr:hypothetical protein NA57DRAFT_71038 [Rhizodiscina lignyota]
MRLVGSPDRQRATRNANLNTNVVRSLLRSSPLRKRNPIEHADNSATQAYLQPRLPSAMTETQASSTTQPTVFVTLQPTPLGPSPSGMKYGGMSEGTEHTLIAVGSIGATLLVIFAVWIVIRMRQGMCLTEACMFKKRSRYKTIGEVTPPLGRWSAAGTEWDRKIPLQAQDIHERTMTGLATLPPRPSATLTRNNSANSQRSLQRSQQRRPSDSGAGNWPIRKSPADSAVARSPAMPSNARIVTDADTPYDDEEADSPTSLPSYLKGARNLPTRRPPHETSRFSWTNSQAPRTPATVTNDTVPNQRYSVATARSSIARFRTVESWVGNQAGRIDEESFQRHMKQTNPEEPDMPKDAGPRHRTNLSEATVFRHHPGTEVLIDRGSLVPSEILDGHVTDKRLGDDRPI